MLDDRPGAGYANKDYHYLYDGLDRLIEVERGVWNGSSMTLGVRSQEWSLDMLGRATGHVHTRLKRQRSRWTHLTSWPRSRFGLVWSVRK